MKGFKIPYIPFELIFIFLFVVLVYAPMRKNSMEYNQIKRQNELKKVPNLSQIRLDTLIHLTNQINCK